MGAVKPSAGGGGGLRGRRRTILIVTAPLVSVATLMLGLRVGAGNAVRAASVFAAPPGKPAIPGGPVPLAWQVITYLEDRGVRETIEMRGLTVILRSQGKEARWTGASNPDGVAEATFELPGLSPNDPVSVEVLAEGEAEPLASGVAGGARPGADWGRPAGDDGQRAAARPSKREGSIGIDVVVEGERLIVGFDSVLWAHVTPLGTHAPAKIAIEATPEPGLLLASAPQVGCDGWAELTVAAQSHVVGITVEATGAPEGKGVWFGALPVAGGAFFIGAPRFVPAGTAETAVLVAPNPRTVVYAEVDDEQGRVFAAALPVKVEPGDPTPRARFPMPVLASGLHWLVVSGEPRGAEHLMGAAVAKPFLVGGPDAPSGVRPGEACSIGPWLARRPATGFPRWLALDGMATRGAKNRLHHRAGLFIGLVSLLAAAILEVLLLTAASREARAVMLLAELEVGREESDREKATREGITANAPGGGLAVALLVALLGFALLGALMIAKG